MSIDTTLVEDPALRVFSPPKERERFTERAPPPSKSPLRYIADAIVDLRYADMMEMANLLHEMASKPAETPSPENFAALIHNWAMKVREATK
jgi:hypothetical protein